MISYVFGVKIITSIVSVLIIRQIVIKTTNYDFLSLVSEVIRIMVFTFFMPLRKRKFRDLKNMLVMYCNDKKSRVTIAPVYFPPKINKLAIGTPKKYPSLIAYSSIWLTLVTGVNQLWEIAFIQSVGHELGHRKDLSENGIDANQDPGKMRFFSWVRECRCDFYGVYFVNAIKPFCTKSEILKALEEKSKVYQPLEADRSKPNGDHPSWEFRINLLNNHTHFDENVIREIAMKADYNNHQYIEELVQIATLDKWSDPIICPWDA